MKLSRYKRSSPVSYAFGATLTYELLKVSPNLIKRVFLRPNQKHSHGINSIIAQLAAFNIPIIENTKAFNVLGAKDNCLIIAEFDKPTMQLEATAETPHIVLVNPSDAGNLGTIIRSAVAFGYNNLAIITPATDHFDPKVVRASMGAIFHINIELFASFDDYLAKYETINSSRKRLLYSFMINPEAVNLADVTLNDGSFSLIFGNEASGLPQEFADKTQAVFISQTPLVDSLNLSIAAGVAMYNFRQKLQ